MLRMLTAGESHGPMLVTTVEGLPAGLRVLESDFAEDLARRRLGAGRGARMKFEADRIEIVAGVRHGRTMGGPVAVLVHNTEWPKWEQAMSPHEPEDDSWRDSARGAALTRPRPGHADYAGMLKYDHNDARPILERASARETAARSIAGTLARLLLDQVLDARLVAHTVALGEVAVPADAPWPTAEDTGALDADPLRCWHQATSAQMLDRVEQTRKAGDTLGGVVEVLAYGVPVGLGSFVHADRRLDARLAGSLMSIQAIKGVEVGDGFATARVPGSAAHDEMERDAQGAVRRRTARSGGIEGGMTTGEVVRVRAAMKPISTVPRALATINMATGAPDVAINQRSDVCAVPAAGVVAQGVTAFVLAEAACEKFGGDSVREMRANADAYRQHVAERLTFADAPTGESTTTEEG